MYLDLLYVDGSAACRCCSVVVEVVCSVVVDVICSVVVYVAYSVVVDIVCTFKLRLLSGVETPFWLLYM